MTARDFQNRSHVVGCHKWFWCHGYLLVLHSNPTNSRSAASSVASSIRCGDESVLAEAALWEEKRIQDHLPSLPWANPTIFRDAVRKVNTVYVSLERPICAPIWGESAKWLILLGPQVARAQILDNYQVGDGISTQIPENNGERGKLGVDFEFPKTRNPKCRTYRFGL